MTLTGSISGSLQIIPVNVLDTFVLELAGWAVAQHCKNAGIEASLVAVVSGNIEVGPNGKTYSLELKLKVKVGDAYVLKIFKAAIFVPFVGLWSIVYFNYVEDVSI